MCEVDESAPLGITYVAGVMLASGKPEPEMNWSGEFSSVSRRIYENALFRCPVLAVSRSAGSAFNPVPLLRSPLTGFWRTRGRVDRIL